VSREPRARAPRRPEAPNARRAAIEAFELTLTSLQPAEIALERFERGLEERDRRLARELLFGALRWKRRLEHVIESASGRRTSAIDEPLRAVLLVAAVQLLLLDRVPAHAAVSEAVDEARRRLGAGAAGFVNAVLRRISAAPNFAAWPVAERDERRRLAIETSHPDRLVERWWQRFGGERTRALLESSNRGRPIHLLAFDDRGGRDALAERLTVEGCATTPSLLSPNGLVVLEEGAGSAALFEGAAYRDGAFYVQDEASQAAAWVPPPLAGERVLDAAAAPGGKGLALVAREPSVRLVSADRSYRRLARLRANLERLGRRGAIVAADASLPPWPAVFDRVVFDAPCSGSGTLRRHPELKWRFRETELVRLAASASNQLLALADAVAPGGLLVHVTCSIEPEENEEVGESLLAARADFTREPLDAERVPGGAASLVGQGRWRTLPEDGHDGFSVGVFRRAGSSP
jgi:16S rRNA (cytosine967-C5)-methyltransferase